MEEVYLGTHYLQGENKTETSIAWSTLSFEQG